MIAEEYAFPASVLSASGSRVLSQLRRAPLSIDEFTL